jgi:signal transduction histidine kinase
MFWQRRVGRELQEEVRQLAGERSRDVEYDFVLKAIGLSVWHIDTATGQLTFDKDFRAKRELMGTDGGSMSENASLLVPEDAQRVQKNLENLCAGISEDYHEQYRIVSSDPSKFYWEESYAIVAERDISGRPTRVIGTTQPIDDRKSLETALKTALTKAEESDRLKSAFIANMSHEIRTPLNAIIGFTSVLPDIDGKEERQELINLIQENNQKLLRIIDDVMNISKIEAGKEQLQMATFDINMILDELVAKYQPKVKEDVVLTSQYASPEGQQVTTDLSRLMESLSHLLSNAAKFTDHGSITVGYDPVTNHRLRLWVRDTGKGIAPENTERVFERFFKVDEFVPGAGLGLSLCRVMAFSMGGTVGVESTFGEGSTFWMEIPV